jgi:lipoate-protein ligase A
MKIRWIDAGRVEGLRSQSIYHGMAYAKADKSLNTIIVSVPADPYMCVGYFQDPIHELDLNYCKNNNLPIIRRETGGGAVYIDDQQMFVQWIFSPEHLPKQVGQKFQMFLDPMISTYKHFGIEAYRHKDHDVHVKGQKIIGTGAARIGKAEVITGNFIAGFDTEHMTGAMNLPSELMRIELKNSLDVFMSSLAKEQQAIENFEQLKAVYKSQCRKMYDFEIMEDSFTANELAWIEKLDKKLRSDEWTYGIKKPKQACRIVKIHSGVWLAHVNLSYEVKEKCIELTLRIVDNVIEFIRINLKSKVNRDKIERLEDSFRKIDFREDQLIKILDDLENSNELKELHISKSEFMEAFLKIIRELHKISGGG